MTRLKVMSQVSTWKFCLLLLASICLVAAEEKADGKAEENPAGATFVSGSVNYDTSHMWQDKEGRLE